jgi:arylsulfatase A-like enzyme
MGSLATFSKLLENARRLYRVDSSALDDSLDRLWQRLRSDKERVETHVLVVSDHGESLGEAGALGHGETLTPNEVHVPFFIVSPRLTSGLRPDVAGSVDVAATLLDLAGVEADSRGRSLIRGVQEVPLPGEPRALGMSESSPQESGEAQRFFAVLGRTLYTGNSDQILVEDQREMSAPEELEPNLQQLFAAFEAAYLGSSAATLDDESTREALEALGYLVPEPAMRGSEEP